MSSALSRYDQPYLPGCQPEPEEVAAGRRHQRLFVLLLGSPIKRTIEYEDEVAQLAEDAESGLPVIIGVEAAGHRQQLTLSPAEALQFVAAHRAVCEAAMAELTGLCPDIEDWI